MTIVVSTSELDMFASRWPCSGLRNHEPMTFKFDTNGNLVDIEGANGNEDGGAMVALSEDASTGKIGSRL